MKSRAFLISSTLTLSIAATSCGGTPDTTADVAAIGKVRSNFAEAFSAGNTTKLVALYTDDAVVMSENQKSASGKAAIEAMYKQTFGEATPSMTLNAEETKVFGDWAFDRGQFMTTMTPKVERASPMMEHGKYIVVLHKEADGSWKVAREIGNSNDAPAPPPAPATKASAAKATTKSAPAKHGATTKPAPKSSTAKPAHGR